MITATTPHPMLALSDEVVAAVRDGAPIVALESTGKRLDAVRAFVADHPELRHAFYKVPHRPGITGTAANFVLHVSDLMDRRRPLAAVGRTLGVSHRARPAAGGNVVGALRTRHEG